MKKVIFVIISILFTLNLSACEENSNVGEIKRISYDIESDGITRIVSNGENQEVARFMLYIDEEEMKNLAYLEFTLYSETAQKEGPFLDFFDALDKFQVVINGEVYNNPFVPINQSAFYIGLHNIGSLSKDEPMEIILLADVNARYPESKGRIGVAKLINFSDEKLSDPIPAKHDPCLGESCETSFLIGDIENTVKYAEIEIINEDLGEECTDVEVKLNDGQCVYNQCQGINCGNGDCFMDLESGAALCDCDDGYTTWEGSDFISCDERLGRFDIETTSELRHVSNGQEVLLAEWDIFINNAEDANFTNIGIHISGNKDSFSNFKFSIYNENHFFGGVQNESPYSFDLDDMSISFGVSIAASNSFPLYKGSATRIGLYATVNGQSGEQITAAITYAGIFSRDVFYEDQFTEHGIPLKADNRLGDDFNQSSIAGSGYTTQINPLIRIQ